MFSIVNRIGACSFMRAFVILLAAVFICISVLPNVMAREVEREVVVDPGDADGPSGFKYYTQPELSSNGLQLSRDVHDDFVKKPFLRKSLGGGRMLYNVVIIYWVGFCQR